MDPRDSFPLQERHSPWALRPEAITVIARAMKGEIGAEELEQRARSQAGDAPPAPGSIAVIPLKGLLTPKPSFLSLLFGGGGGLQSFRRSLREALASEEVVAILLDVDSPGGSTDLIAETAAEVRAARGQKPIVAISNTTAASAAYWIASQADELVVTPSGEVGSIGVFILHEEFSKMDEQHGVTTTLISSGKYKTEGNPYEPLTEEAKQAFQAVCDDIYGQFTADVAKGRGVKPGAVRGGFGEGRMVLAKHAVEEGMADRVATFEETAAQLAGGPRRARSKAEDAGSASDEGTEPNRARGQIRGLRLARPRHL